MNIEIHKLNHRDCEYKIVRRDQSTESITLNIKTFLLHDICHYVVEKTQGYDKGFWGLLAGGSSFDSLFGKENEMTNELRLIEKVVGPIQSLYSGNFTIDEFPVYTSHLGIIIDLDAMKSMLAEIKYILDEWENLPYNNSLSLSWRE